MANHIIKHKRKYILLLDACLPLFFWLAGFLTSLMMSGGFRCPFFKNGIICPGCGGTRCVSSLSKLEIAKAFSYHPYVCLLFFYLLVFLFLLNLYCLFDLGFAKKAVILLGHYKTIVVIMIGFVLFGISRNFIHI